LRQREIVRIGRGAVGMPLDQHVCDRGFSPRNSATRASLVQRLLGLRQCFRRLRPSFERA
jgi:hypothetical protein